MLGMLATFFASTEVPFTSNNLLLSVKCWTAPLISASSWSSILRTPLLMLIATQALPTLGVFTLTRTISPALSFGSGAIRSKEMVSLPIVIVVPLTLMVSMAPRILKVGWVAAFASTREAV